MNTPEFEPKRLTPDEVLDRTRDYMREHPYILLTPSLVMRQVGCLHGQASRAIARLERMGALQAVDVDDTFHGYEEADANWKGDRFDRLVDRMEKLVAEVNARVGRPALQLEVHAAAINFLGFMDLNPDTRARFEKAADAAYNEVMA